MTALHFVILLQRIITAGYQFDVSSAIKCYNSGYEKYTRYFTIDSDIVWF